MGYRVTLDLPGLPNPEALADCANTMARANADWYLEQWAQGLEPPCCAKCGSIRYRNTAVSGHLACRGAASVFASGGFANCFEIAAISAGHKQAKARRDGMDPLAAADRYCVVLVDGVDRNGETKNVYHAVVQTDEGLDDPAGKM